MYILRLNLDLEMAAFVVFDFPSRNMSHDSMSFLQNFPGLSPALNVGFIKKYKTLQVIYNYNKSQYNCQLF